MKERLARTKDLLIGLHGDGHEPAYSRGEVNSTVLSGAIDLVASGSRCTRRLGARGLRCQRVVLDITGPGMLPCAVQPGAAHPRGGLAQLGERQAGSL